MRTADEIKMLLEELEHRTAGSLEDQDLDFKAWNQRSMEDSIKMVISIAVCMANGGGGTVVFGVDDSALGRSRAIVGVPPEVDVNRLKKAVYDSTDPKIMPVFEDLPVPEGFGRLEIMQVYPGIPPYTDTSGRGTVRIGKDCQPLTGSLRRRVMVETGETDFTAQVVDGNPHALLSPSAMERLRDIAQRERVPDDFARLSDVDLLAQIGVLKSGRLTRAGVFLAGTESAIREHIPGYAWTHLKMETDTRYSDRADGVDALPIALSRLLERINTDNPIRTVEHGMLHFEYRTYPELALREALMNALCHADLRIAGPVMVKQYPDRLEISNPGGFIAGITPDNILHHSPAARNPLLVDALARLRLVNRSNLGISRMYESFLVEGKESPLIREIGESVLVTFQRCDFSAEFRGLVAEENRAGRMLSVEQLIALRFLLGHSELDTATFARLCQRTESQARDILAEMEHVRGYLERGGTGRGTYWALRPEIHRRLAGSGHPERDRRINWEAAKTRVLSVLMERSRRGESGLSNADIRGILHYDRSQTGRLMQELMRENPGIRMEGRRRWARYAYSMKDHS